MEFNKLIKQPASWMISSPDEQDIVLTSRIRLARNLRDKPFPGWATRAQRSDIFAQTFNAAKELTSLKNGYVSEFSDLSQLEKQILVERHLISRELAARAEGCGVAISGNKNLSIMLNEEDHLRIQFILPGEQFKKAWSSINKIDNELEQKLPYAYNSQLGYLTACPTNLGTGMRASAMLHLPGLVISGYMEQVVKAIHDLNLTVRGIYGEGTQGLGNLFQVSNQTTLGESEEDIISKLKRIVHDLTVQESNARLRLFEQNGIFIADRIARAYGLLKHSLLLPAKEALDHISMLRLGVSLGLCNPDMLPELNKLILDIQSAHLQYLQADGRLPMEVNDSLRADIVRHRLKTIPSPGFAIDNKNNQSHE